MLFFTVCRSYISVSFCLLNDYWLIDWLRSNINRDTRATVVDRQLACHDCFFSSGDLDLKAVVRKFSHGPRVVRQPRTAEYYRLRSLSASSHTYYYLVFITHSLFHSRLKTFLFCKSFPPQPFLFFLHDSLHGFPGLFTVVCEHICFLLFSFFLFFYTF